MCPRPSRELGAVFGTLAAEAGLSLTQDAGSKAADVLAQTEAGHTSGNARLAVRLLNQAIAAQAHRVDGSPEALQPDTLHTVIESDIPECLDRDELPSEEGWSGQYL
jgi:AAA lid domain